MIYETDPSPLPLSGLLGLPPYRAIGDYVHAENAKAEAVNEHPGPDFDWQPEIEPEAG